MKVDWVCVCVCGGSGIRIRECMCVHVFSGKWSGGVCVCARSGRWTGCMYVWCVFNRRWTRGVCAYMHGQHPVHEGGLGLRIVRVDWRHYRVDSLTWGFIFTAGPQITQSSLEVSRALKTSLMWWR